MSTKIDAQAGAHEAMGRNTPSQPSTPAPTSSATAALADALHALVVDPAERQRRGQALRARAESFTWERNVQTLMRLLAG